MKTQKKKNRGITIFDSLQEKKKKKQKGSFLASNDYYTLWN